MASIAEILAQCWTALTGLIPRLGLLRRNQGGVRFGRKGKAKALRPGLFWWMPLLHDVRKCSTARQTANLAAQWVTLCDGTTVLASIVVVYTVDDPFTALVEVEAVDEAVVDVGLRATVEELAGRSLPELIEGIRSGSTENELGKRARRHLRPLGVKVLSAFLAEMGPGAYRVASDGESSHPLPLR